MSENSEDYRKRMLARLQNKFSHGEPAEIQIHREALAKYETEKLEAHAAIQRLLSPMRASTLCPACWYMRGVEKQMQALPHADPANFDKFYCNVCNYQEDRAARSF